MDKPGPKTSKTPKRLYLKIDPLDPQEDWQLHHGPVRFQLTDDPEDYIDVQVTPSGRMLICAGFFRALNVTPGGGCNMLYIRNGDK